MSIYLEDIEYLKDSCKAYKLMELSSEEFKNILWTISQRIVAIDESRLRTFLMIAEAELDSIYYTTDENLIHDKSKKVVERIEDKLQQLS